MLVVIGRTWLNTNDENGGRRLDNEGDFVRMEIAGAIERNLIIMPVLVDGAEMPREIDLPEILRPLATSNAVRVGHVTLSQDANRLAQEILAAIRRSRFTRWLRYRLRTRGRAFLQDRRAKSNPTCKN